MGTRPDHGVDAEVIAEHELRWVFPNGRVIGMVEEQRAHQRLVGLDGSIHLFGQVAHQPFAQICKPLEHRDEPFVSGGLGDVPRSAVTQWPLVVVELGVVLHNRNLVEFLEARLAEDELMTNAATDGTADWHVFYAYRDIKDGDGHYVVLADGQYPTAEQAAHIARHNPARILRQCEAARVVIAEFLGLEAIGDLPGSSVAESALKQLASVHCDHADFDQTWI